MIIPGGFFAVKVGSPPPTGDYTSDAFWQDITGSSHEFVWNGTRWAMPSNFSSGLMGLEVTVGGANAGWQIGFRPSTVTITLNSGVNNGFGDGSFLSPTVYILDADDVDIGTQVYNFTAYNQSITHTFPLSFGSFDIAYMQIDTFLYLDTDGPYIEFIDFA